MNWHLISAIARWVVFAYSLLAIFQVARSGAFRRIWNWPMRIGVVCWLLFACLSWLGGWASYRYFLGSSLRLIFQDLGLILFNIGLVSLVVFAAGFLITMVRDFRSPPAVVMTPLDRVQELILQGRMFEAVELYQEKMVTDMAEAVTAVGQISASLKAGLRV